MKQYTYNMIRMHIFVGWLWIDGCKSFSSDRLSFFKVSSFSEKKQRQPAVCPLIPENHTKEFRIRCLGISTTEKRVLPWGIFFFKDGDMSWTAPEGSQTLGCLLPPTVPSDFSGSSSTCWIIMDHLPWKPGGVHPASQIIYLRKMAAVRLFIYIKQRWFYDSLETLLWWKGSMASRWMSESCAASTVIWVLRCFSLYFAVTSSCVNRRSLTTFSTSFGSTTTTTTITSTTQLPEVAASTKECLFLQTGVGYIFAQAAWHLKLSTWKRKHICITYQSLDFSCALSISKYSSEKTYDYHRCQQRTWIINDCSQTTSHPTVVASPSRRHLNDIKIGDAWFHSAIDSSPCQLAQPHHAISRRKAQTLCIVADLRGA